METLTSHKAPVLALAYSEKMQVLVSAGRDSSILIWNVRTLFGAPNSARGASSFSKVHLIASMDGHRGDICTLTFHSDGRTLISGARDNTMKIWDCETHAEGREMRGNSHNADVRRLIFIDEKTMLSCALDGYVKVWSIGAFGEKDLSSGPLDSFSVEAEADILKLIMAGEQAAAGEDLFENVDSMINKVLSHNAVWSMEVRPKLSSHGDHILVTGSTNNEVKVYRFRDGQSPMELFQDFVSHSAEVTTLALAKSDRILLTGSLDCKVILYDRVNTRRVTDWDFGGAVMQLHVDAHDKHVYVGGTDYTMKAYELTGERRHVLDLVGHSGKVISMAISKNNVLCSGAHDFKILLWKLKAEYKLGDMGKPNSMFPIASLAECHSGHCMSMQFDATGEFLLTCGNDRALACWKVGSGGNSLTKKWLNASAHDGVVATVCWAGKKIFSGGWDHMVRAWNIDGRKNALATLKGHKSRIHSVQAAGDGTIVYSVQLTRVDSMER